MMIRLRQIISTILVLVLVNACQPSAMEPDHAAQPVVVNTVAPTFTGTMLEPQGFIQRTHDPVIAHEGDVYYVFSTGSRIPFLCSKNKINWEFCGRVFEKDPLWIREINPNLVDLWAPDISYFNDQWHLYYAASNFGSQNSAIGLVTNLTLDPNSPDYNWVDHGIVLRSQPGDKWNAIDPNLVIDENGETWLAWGSFWQGIWMRKIDHATGLFDENDPNDYHLANRSTGTDNTAAIEAPFIVRRAGKWYLFASFDKCCQGIDSTYNVRVGRSDSLTGPYVDREGLPMTEGGGTLILSAYGQWRGPGHNGMLVEEEVYWMVYHAYDSKQIGIPKLRVESLSWDAEGWPSLPSQAK